MKKYIIILVIVIIVIVLVGGYFGYQSYLSTKTSIKDQAVGWKVYTNKDYGFEMTFSDSWKGYSMVSSTWQGWKNDGLGEIGKYNGVELIFKNPQTTEKQKYQDIPIMIFTPDVWQLVQEEKIGVSAAPIPPAKIGENEKYIFATPPRWYGFTDDVGFQEAVDIVKTFSALNNN